MNTGPGAKLADSQQNVRAAERYDLEIKVDLESEHNFYTGLTQNISAGGLFIRTEQPPDMEAVVDVALELPGGEPVEGKAVVVHRVTAEEARSRGVDPGIGVQFVHGDDRFRERIDQFVATLSVKETAA